jgi:hypothetical protein
LTLPSVATAVRDLVVQLAVIEDGPMSAPDLILWGMAVIQEATLAWAIDTGAQSFRRN